MSFILYFLNFMEAKIFKYLFLLFSTALFFYSPGEAYATSCINYQSEQFRLTISSLQIPSNKSQLQNIFNSTKNYFVQTMDEKHIAVYAEGSILEGHVFQIHKTVEPDPELKKHIETVKNWRKKSFCGNRILNLLGIMPGGKITLHRKPLLPGEYKYSDQIWLGNPQPLFSKSSIEISKDRKILILKIPVSKSVIHFQIAGSGSFIF